MKDQICPGCGITLQSLDSQAPGMCQKTRQERPLSVKGVTRLSIIRK